MERMTFAEIDRELTTVSDPMKAVIWGIDIATVRYPRALRELAATIRERDIVAEQFEALTKDWHDMRDERDTLKEFLEGCERADLRAKIEALHTALDTARNERDAAPAELARVKESK